MAELKGRLTMYGTVVGTLNNQSQTINTGLAVKPAPPVKDYEQLDNKPQINGVTLEGNLTSEDLNMVYDDTTENWNARVGFIPPAGAIIIYSDYATSEGVDVPNIKIGDGLAYLIDLPFVGDDARNVLLSHIQDTTAHVDAADRMKWDNKVSCSLEQLDEEEYLLAFVAG